MPSNVFREDVQRLAADGAQIVEVLPRDEYNDLHIAGALSFPLTELGGRASELNRARPVVTYCNDFL